MLLIHQKLRLGCGMSHRGSADESWKGLSGRGAIHPAIELQILNIYWWLILAASYVQLIHCIEVQPCHLSKVGRVTDKSDNLAMLEVPVPEGYQKSRVLPHCLLHVAMRCAGCMLTIHLLPSRKTTAIASISDVPGLLLLPSIQKPPGCLSPAPEHWSGT